MRAGVGSCAAPGIDWSARAARLAKMSKGPASHWALEPVPDSRASSEETAQRTPFGKEASRVHFTPGPRNVRHLPTEQAKQRPLPRHSGLPSSSPGRLPGGWLLGWSGTSPPLFTFPGEARGRDQPGSPLRDSWGGQGPGQKALLRVGQEPKSWHCGASLSSPHLGGPSLGSSLPGNARADLLPPSAHSPGPAHVA